MDKQSITRENELGPTIPSASILPARDNDVTYPIVKNEAPGGNSSLNEDDDEDDEDDLEDDDFDEEEDDIEGISEGDAAEEALPLDNEDLDEDDFDEDEDEDDIAWDEEDEEEEP